MNIAQSVRLCFEALHSGVTCAMLMNRYTAQLLCSNWSTIINTYMALTFHYGRSGKQAIVP